MFNLLFIKLHLDERGASMVEYSLLVVLIAIAGFLAVSYFGDSVSGAFSTIADSLTNAGG